MAAPTLDRDTEAPARARRTRKGPSGLLLIAPSLVFMALLFGWPMVQGVLLAFRGDQGFTLEFVQRMVTDANFWPAVRNTLLLIVVLIPVQFAFAVAMALLLRAKPRLANVYFFVWAIPLAVSDLAAAWCGSPCSPIAATSTPCWSAWACRRWPGWRSTTGRRSSSRC